MSAAQTLLDILRADVLDKISLYHWNAKYAVFRGTHEATDYAIVKQGARLSLVRHAYVDAAGVKWLELVNAGGVYRRVKLVRNIVAASAADGAKFSSMDVTAAGARATLISVGVVGTLVVVDAFRSTADLDSTFGFGNIEHAGAPSYRIIGTLQSPVDGTTKDVSIKAYVRGEHFLKESKVISIPVGGGDTFLTSADDVGGTYMGTVLSKALRNLTGGGSVTVDDAGAIDVTGGANYGSVAAFHQAVVEPAFATGPGAAYGSAAEQSMVYSYSMAPTSSELAGAIKNLEISKLANDTLEAIQKLHTELYPTAAPPPGTPTTDAEVRRLTDALNAARAKSDQIEVQRVAAQRVADDATRELALVKQGQAAIERRAGDAEQRLVVMKADRDGLAARSEQLVKDVAALRAQLAVTQPADVAALQIKLDAATDELRAANADLANARAEIAQLKALPAPAPGPRPSRPTLFDIAAAELRVKAIKAELRVVRADAVALEHAVDADPSNEALRLRLEGARERALALNTEFFSLL